MAEPFIEERLTIGVRLGARYGDAYAVEVITTSGGQESRRLVHPFPIRRYAIDCTVTTADLYADLLNLYHRCYGQFAGFRVKLLDDYTTNADTAAPTASDQVVATVTAGSVYQLQKFYGIAAPVLSIGRPVRALYKPVANTTRVAIAGDEITQTNRTRWTVDTTTGVVTFSANITATITGISAAPSAIVTTSAAHGLVVGDSVYHTGVVGMVEINGLRGTVSAKTSTTYTVGIDSTLFTAYTSGGTLHTRPQTGEAVTAGCEFDLPMRFNSGIDIEMMDRGIRGARDIQLIELITL